MSDMNEVARGQGAPPGFAFSGELASSAQDIRLVALACAVDVSLPDDPACVVAARARAFAAFLRPADTALDDEEARIHCLRAAADHCRRRPDSARPSGGRELTSAVLFAAEAWLEVVERG